jgi:signal transduction histidine kinase
MRQPGIEWRESDRDRFLSKIESESTRVIRLVNDLFDSSAIEAGILRLEKDWCDLGLVIDAAIGVVPRAAEATVVQGFAGLGPIWADHDRLQQVFVNLISNGLRHNPEGTRISIERVSEPEDQTLLIRVSDTGTGLSPQVLSSLVGQPLGDGEQRGLGLKIASGIVESHGGSLLPDLGAVGGASFLLALPVEPEEQGDGSIGHQVE